MIDGFINHDFYLLAVAGALGEGLAESGEQLCLLKWFLGAIALDDKKVIAEYLLECAEAMVTVDALASSSDTGTASTATGVDNLGVGGCTLWAAQGLVGLKIDKVLQ